MRMKFFTAALVLALLGGYRPAAISLVNPGWRGWAAGFLVLPFGILVSLSVGGMSVIMAGTGFFNIGLNQKALFDDIGITQADTVDYLDKLRITPP